MSRLNLAQSDHVVKLLVDPAAIITPASAVVEGLDAAWVGMVRRLVMEYCPSGSLSDLRRLRMARLVTLFLLQKHLIVKVKYANHHYLEPFVSRN